MPEQKKSPQLNEKAGLKNLDKKRGKGRPTTYTPELGKYICDVVASHPYGSQKLHELYDDYPHQVCIDRWRNEHDDFCLAYAKAKILQANLLAEDILNIAHNAASDCSYNAKGERVTHPDVVARSRLIVDTHKWIAAKLVPKIYGRDAELQDKIVENAGLREELERLRTELDEKHKKDY